MFPRCVSFYHGTHGNALRTTRKEAGEVRASRTSATFPSHFHHIYWTYILELTGLQDLTLERSEAKSRILVEG